MDFHADVSRTGPDAGRKPADARGSRGLKFLPLPRMAHISCVDHIRIDDEFHLGRQISAGLPASGIFASAAIMASRRGFQA